MSEPPVNSTPEFVPGELLRRARRVYRLSQRELAARAGVSPETLARVESGCTGNPGVEVLVRLFGAMRCRLAVLTEVGGELPPHPGEDRRDWGERHYPAHLDLHEVHKPAGWIDPAFYAWWGWRRHRSWERGARIPPYTFTRARQHRDNPPLNPETGEPLPRGWPESGGQAPG